jgi:hypothetical protein
MTTVYIWGALNLTGHASVHVKNRYLSFHPYRSDADKLDAVHDALPDAVRENLLTLNPLSLDLPKKPDAVKEVLSNLSKMGHNIRGIIDDLDFSRLVNDLQFCRAMLASPEQDEKVGNGVTASIDINWLNEDAMLSELASIEAKIKPPNEAKIKPPSLRYSGY